MKKSVLLIIIVIFFGIFFGQKCNAELIHSSGFSNEDKFVSVSIQVIVSKCEKNKKCYYQYISIKDDEELLVTGNSLEELSLIALELHSLKRDQFILKRIYRSFGNELPHIINYVFDFLPLKK